MTKPNLQEILCCIGQPPGAIPFQYVIGKAIMAAELDWRFLTLDVSPDQLAAALGGMEAMGFCGATLYDPHDAVAAEHLGKVTKLASSVGQVDLIYREKEGEESQLIGDSTIGTTCFELISEKVSLVEQRLVVLGSSLSTRAVAIAIGSQAGELVIVPSDPEHGKQLAVDVNTYWDSEVARCAPTEELEGVLDGAVAIVQTNEQTGADRQLGLDLSSLSKDTVFADTSFNPPKTEFLETAIELDCPIINGVDLLLKRFSHAFKVWSGQDPDLRAMREALEEYLLV